MVFVDVAATRAHLERLSGWGMSQCMIADATDGWVTQTAIGFILRGERRWVTSDVATALAAVGPHPHPRQRRYLAIGAQRRIRALHRRGWRCDDISAAAGLHPDLAARLLWRRPTVLPSTWHAIADVYEPLSAKTELGPSVISIRRATESAWPLPLDWDTADIDHPESWPIPAINLDGHDAEVVDRRRVAVAELTRVGLSSSQIAVQLRVTERTVVRDRAVLRDTGVDIGAAAVAS